MTNRNRFAGFAGAITASAITLALVACAQDKPGSEPVVERVTTVDAYAPPAPVMAEREAADMSYAVAPPPPPVMMPQYQDRERYDGEEVSAIRMVATHPVSTFSVDVDTGAYANVRRFLSDGQMPPQAAVRTEELINYFRYDYPAPADRSQPFSVTTDMAITPWNPDTRLLRVGLRGYDLPRAERPPANLVFLLDVSGSMNAPDKLPLVKTAMNQLAGELGEQDRVSIVVYAGATGVVLEPTNDTRAIRRALNQLSAGGSTAGAAGLRLAYDRAREGFIEGGVNRVILATDGDFNVGISDRDALVDMIERQRDSGITLTTLGFGTGNYNEAMMEQIADHGNGNYAYIDSAMEARKVLSEEMQSTLFTIAHDVKIQVEFNPQHVSQYRLIGYENRALREEDFDNDTVDAGDIGAGHQVTALYEIVPAGEDGWVRPRRYDGNNGEERSVVRTRGQADEIAFVQLRYKLPGQDRSRLIQRPVSTRVLADARAARGDMAFVAAVAAYGQRLRGDTLLRGFDYDDAATLAGRQRGYWREEFLQLVGLAETLDAS
ncbi:vWA domain-containing protein [Aurantiacibacter sp. MUD11]|uniref:vWA domain-containing protein n=1 Tax=Aurantiacibacter sp. MUD11 TaxID=3003265 RepID=UPI002ED208E3